MSQNKHSSESELRTFEVTAVRSRDQAPDSGDVDVQVVEAESAEQAENEVEQKDGVKHVRSELTFEPNPPEDNGEKEVDS